MADPTYVYEARNVVSTYQRSEGNRTKPPSSKEKGAPINIRPFWVCPRELLLHNIFIGSQIHVADGRMLTTNVMANAGITLMAGQFSVKGVNGAIIWLGLNAGLWALVTLAPTTFSSLVAPELRDAMLF